MRRPDGLLVVCGLTAALLLAAPTLAQAQVSKCQAALEKEVFKLEKDMFLRMNKCADAIRAEREKGLTGSSPKGSLAKGAAFCEKMLAKTLALDQGPNRDGKSKLDKFFAGVDKAHETGKCDDSARQDLDDLGHFVSGENAPGTNAQDFVREWLAIQAIYAAWGKQALTNDETRTRIQDAIEAPGDTKGNAATDCAGGACSDDPNALCAFNTDCDGPATCVGATINRPNLCAFHKDTSSPANGLAPLAGTLNPVCRAHGCRLEPGDGSPVTGNDSEANVTTALINIIGPMSGTVILNVCDLGNLPPPFTLKDYYLLSGTATNGVMKTPLGGVGDVCLRTYRAEGWCDCKPGGSALPVLNSEACRDHVVDPDDPGSDACPGGRPEEGTEEECVCAPPGMLNCGGIVKCQARTPYERCKKDSDCSTSGDLCVADDGGGRCHAGTWRGEQRIELTGSTTEGDCLVFTTSNLTLIPSGQEGPDGEACTDDDLVAQGGQALVPLTTGSAQAVAEDAIIGVTNHVCGWHCEDGGSLPCDASGCDAAIAIGDAQACTIVGDCTAPGVGACVQTGRLGGSCLESSNCDVLGDDGNCDTRGSIRGRIPSGTEYGVALPQCSDFESSDFSGFRLVGAFPVLDGPGLGDVAFTYRFVCQ